jgi:hypothetical protein
LLERQLFRPLNRALDSALSGIIPATNGMTLTASWTARGTGYTTLSPATAASVRVDAVISNTDDGMLMESGGTSKGLFVYVYDGVLYFQCGDGTAFGTSSNRAETSYTLPVGEYSYIVEWSANTTNAVLYVNGLAVDSQAFSDTEISGLGQGTVGQVKDSCAVNRGGWTTNGAGDYTNTISACYIFSGQVTPEV